jgi:hypothetical protein
MRAYRAYSGRRLHFHGLVHADCRIVVVVVVVVVV